MSAWTISDHYEIRILEKPEAISAVEDLQRLVWGDNETEIVPTHMLLAAIYNGGLVIGVYDIQHFDPLNSNEIQRNGSQYPGQEILVGFIFGFPGIYSTPDGPRLKHSSHMLGVHPDYRNQGIGFALKRAQWQMVRRQGLDRITWTFDPLFSRNAHLNITKLGAVCNTYKREAYGELRDGLNAGTYSDRFQVDWWVNSQRVSERLSKIPRPKLDLTHFLAANTTNINPTQIGRDGLPYPPRMNDQQGIITEVFNQPEKSILMVEIPFDFFAIKTVNPDLAIEWRIHTRLLFENLFRNGYIITDFIHLSAEYERSFYILSHGDSTL